MTVTYLFKPLLLLIVLGGLLVQCSTPKDTDREANRLFVQAFRLTEQALKLEQDDPAEAYTLYQQALQNIDQIIENYPDTQVAVDV
ncbi:hypothetical protein QLX67_12860, partial [Balneolaceae bacterium ANBcel3]|nr:hypothetical protein [Balneolaceae bacterium ANBcel3]